METEEEPRRVNLLPCAECGSEFAPAITRTRICPTCVTRNNDISAGVPRELLIQWCRYCSRYYGPPWTLCQRESKELLGLCLKKIRGLGRLHLTDAAFLYTEAHSKRLRVRVTARAEVAPEVTLQQTFDVEFVEVYTQCDACQKQFTPHTWTSCVQLRQRTDNRKTFLYLEQLLLKQGMHKKASRISQERFGLNFYFAQRSAAARLVDFICSALPTAIKDSRELISYDMQNSAGNYKFTTVVDIPRVCKDDLVVLPVRLCKEFGGLNALAVCYRVGSTLSLFDPITLKRVEMSSQQYFTYQQEFRVVSFRGNETEFYIADIAADAAPKLSLDSTLADAARRFARVEVVRVSDRTQFSCTTHLGHILRHGDSVLGYDLTSLGLDELEGVDRQRYLPDVVLIRKFYPERRRRIWQLKRMEVEDEAEVPPKRAGAEQKDFEEFMEELEQDKQQRAKMNLYVDPAASAETVLSAHPEVVQLGELLSDLVIEPSAAHTDRQMQAVMGDLQTVAFKKPEKS